MADAVVFAMSLGQIAVHAALRALAPRLPTETLRPVVRIKEDAPREDEGWIECAVPVDLTEWCVRHGIDDVQTVPFELADSLSVELGPAVEQLAAMITERRFNEIGVLPLPQGLLSADRITDFQKRLSLRLVSRDLHVWTLSIAARRNDAAEG